MTAQLTRILFAGGGTGGHLYPAIAIANRITELWPDGSLEIQFVGTRRGIEYRLRDSLGYHLNLINVRGLVRSLSLTNLLLPFVIVGALIKTWLLLKRLKPAVVVGTGGYVSWPVIKTANLRGIPTVLQEQNSYPGIATRQGASKAVRIYLGFEGARSYLGTNAEITVTGNPVRRTIADGDRAEAVRSFSLDPSKKTIVILGGSQGARAINQAVLKSLEAGSLRNGYQVLWQTGKRDYKEVTASAGDKASSCSLFPFVENMALVYAAADLAVARAGALTIAELAVCRVPAVLVPYPHAAEDHQRRNAEEMTERGMARMIDEKDLAGHDIIADAIALLESDEYAAMRTALDEETSRRRPAVDVIAEDIIELIKAGA